jgi:hypothetical protein
MTLTPLQEAEQEWRVIPEFELYEINLLKDIRYVENKTRLHHSLSVNGYRYYHLNSEPGLVRLRCSDDLLNITFPELKDDTE